MTSAQQEARDVVFISKATPGDDEFVLWLAPRLEAAGFSVYADIIRLDPGTRWRKELTNTLQTRAVKMLLCARDASLARDGVHEEIGIAEDLSRELSDPKFIIPLRLEKYKKVFGIGELHYVDFSKSWADGLNKLTDALRKANVPCAPSTIQISPNWEQYRRRNSVTVKNEPESLTSNWLRIVEVPDSIAYFSPTGAVDHGAMQRSCAAFRYPAQAHQRGFFSFASLDDVNEGFMGVGRFEQTGKFETAGFIANGLPEQSVRPREASNLVQSMFRKAWQARARSLGLLEYAYSTDSAFHVSETQGEIGKRFFWGTQGEKRWSMLRNIAKGHVWQFGVTAIPSFWPYMHFKLKSRVLFSKAEGEVAGPVINDKKAQHRLRRTVCKGWRNTQWHGRLRAFLEMLAGDASYITLMLGSEAAVKIEPLPIFFTSPVSTELPQYGDDAEEEDDSTITGNDPAEDEPQ